MAISPSKDRGTSVEVMGLLKTPLKSFPFPTRCCCGLFWREKQEACPGPDCSVLHCYLLLFHCSDVML